MKLSPSPLILAIAAVVASGVLTATPLRPHGSPAPVLWKTGFSFGEEVPAVGDFNGDGLDDIITFYRSTYSGSLTGDALVSLNTFGDFGTRAVWHEFFGINNETLRVGDFNGDGLDDIATFLHGTGGIVYIALSNGSSFNTSSVWVTGAATLKGVPHIGDFNGDGRDDIASYDNSSGEVRVFLSNGSAFLASGTWLTGFGADVALSGDFNGDGRDDIAGVRATNSTLGAVYVALSTATSFGPDEQWMTDALFDSQSEVFSADFTADGLDDLVLVSRLGNLWVAPSLGDAFQFDPTSIVWNTRIRQGGEICLPGHFDRDLNADLAVFVSGGNNGDVKVSLTGGHAVPDPIDPEVFGYGTMGVPWIFEPVVERPDVQEIPLVLAIVRYLDRPDFGAPLGRDTAFFDELYFGPGKPNLRDWFLEMSQGRFTFSRADVLTIDYDETPGGDTRPQAVQAMADAGFDFRPYDTNGDGRVTTDELCIAVVSNFGTADGQTIGMITDVTYPTGPVARLSTRFAGADHLGPVDLYTHEVSHLIASVDLYSSNCYNKWATLMHCNAFAPVTSLVHLEAWHKMRLGWERPIIYDLRDGPGAAVLDAAQLGGRPPILVYDSELGTGQYYLLEYRSPTSTLGEQIWDTQDERFLRPETPFGGFTAAGYDADFGKRGVAAWYCRMNNPESHARQRVGVNPGAGGIVDATPAGDDVLSDGKILPGPDQILQTVIFNNILPGPNGTLQSMRAGDDILLANRILPGSDGLFSTILAGDDEIKLADDYAWDELVFLTEDPVQLAERGSITHVLDNLNDLSDFKWQGLGMTLQVGTRLHSVNTSTVGWGGPFRPFLESWPMSPVRSGAPITVQGKMGPNLSSFKPTLLCEATGQRYLLDTEAWSSSVGIFTLPSSVPPGDYLFFIESSDSYTSVVSNTVPLTVEDTFRIWLAGNFSRAQINNPAITGPQVDLDGDGLPTLGEFVAGGNPRVAEPHLRPWVEKIGNRIYFRAPLRKTISGVIVEMEYSSNLLTWTQRTPTLASDNYLGDPNLALYERSWSASTERIFFRMRYTVAER